MHGCGGNIIHSFLKSGKLTAETIRADRDVTFGGAAPEPIDRYLGALKSRVKETNATIGLATDGDADRLGAVDDQGETMTLHLVVPILLAHLHKNKSLSGEVIFTVSQSVLMRRMSEAYGLKWRETPIGFKYIAEHMLGGDVLIGAEESGGVGVKGHIPERDGIINSLLLLEAVVTAGKPPSAMIRDLQKEFGAFFYDRRDIYLGKQGRAKPKENLFDSRPDQLAGYRIVEATDKDGLKLMLEDDSWVMIRPSGTEPVLRLYAEATSKQKTRSLLEAAEHRWAR
jgi:phosphomannomutase